MCHNPRYSVLLSSLLIFLNFHLFYSPGSLVLTALTLASCKMSWRLSSSAQNVSDPAFPVSAWALLCIPASWQCVDPPKARLTTLFTHSRDPYYVSYRRLARLKTNTVYWVNIWPNSPSTGCISGSWWCAKPRQRVICLPFRTGNAQLNYALPNRFTFSGSPLIKKRITC